jgi:Tfp pilus assembly protein PilF
MEAILKLNPENVDALNYIGYTWTQRGIRLNDAEKLLRRALGLRPNNGYIQDSWGWYLLIRGRVKEAVVELEKAARLKPNEPTILEHLGDAYLRSNLREKALTQYSDAVKFAEDEESKRKIQTKADLLRRQLVEGKPLSPSEHKAERLPASQ